MGTACHRSSVGTICQVQCGNYLPGPVWELFAMEVHGVWELFARSSVGTTCQVQCGNYLPGPVRNYLPEGTTCQFRTTCHAGPVRELLARSSEGTTCQVQCETYLPDPVWSKNQSPLPLQLPSYPAFPSAFPVPTSVLFSPLCLPAQHLPFYG